MSIHNVKQYRVKFAKNNQNIHYPQDLPVDQLNPKYDNRVSTTTDTSQDFHQNSFTIENKSNPSSNKNVSVKVVNCEDYRNDNGRFSSEYHKTYRKSRKDSHNESEKVTVIRSKSETRKSSKPREQPARPPKTSDFIIDGFIPLQRPPSANIARYEAISRNTVTLNHNNKIFNVANTDFFVDSQPNAARKGLLRNSAVSRDFLVFDRDNFSSDLATDDNFLTFPTMNAAMNEHNQTRYQKKFIEIPVVVSQNENNQMNRNEAVRKSYIKPVDHCVSIPVIYERS